jgi:hypothetical protein
MTKIINFKPNCLDEEHFQFEGVDIDDDPDVLIKKQTEVLRDYLLKVKQL